MEKNLRLASIKVAFIGLLIVTATSTIGVVYPAAYNLSSIILDPANFADNQIAIRFEFFQYGLYLASAFLIASAFFCLKTKFLSTRIRFIVMLVFFAIGGVFAFMTVFGGIGPFPTEFWPANLLVVPAVGAIVFLGIAFIRQMIGKDSIASTRDVGRVMLHLGLIILLLGVFMSENVVYETNAGYMNSTVGEVAPGVYLQVTNINLEYFQDSNNFNMIVTIQVIETDSSNISRIVGIGYATITGHPDWNMISHQVYLQSNALRDVFIAVTGFSTVAPGIYQVTVHTKYIPLISFVWLGAFLMMSAMIPMFAIESQALHKALKGKEEDLYGEVDEDSEQSIAESDQN